MFAFAVIFFACVFFRFFARSVAVVPSVVPSSMHSTQEHLRGLLLQQLYLWPPKRAAAAVCTCDLQHSPPWLLLLFIANRLLVVYHAVLLLCHSYHPAHAFVCAQCTRTCLKFSSCTWLTSSIFILRRFFSSSSDLAHRAPIICNTVVARSFAPDRDSCVLASCCVYPWSCFNEAFCNFPFGYV